VEGQLAAEQEKSAQLAVQREEVEARLRAEHDVQTSLSSKLQGTIDEFRALGARLDQANWEREGLTNVVTYLVGRLATKNSAAKINKRVFSQLLRAVPMSRVNWKNYQVIRRSIYFDEGYYLNQYPDVLAGGIDPPLHYLLYGGAEGRDPSPIFSTNGYLSRYPDVAGSGMNALLHYEIRGQREGRKVAFFNR
jgi:hypothetical protein